MFNVSVAACQPVRNSPLRTCNPIFYTYMQTCFRAGARLISPTTFARAGNCFGRSDSRNSELLLLQNHSPWHNTSNQRGSVLYPFSIRSCNCRFALPLPHCRRTRSLLPARISLSFPLSRLFLSLHLPLLPSPPGFVQYPMDTVCRRIMMTAGYERKFYSNTVDAVMRLSEKEGSRTFYSGVLLAMLIEVARGLVHRGFGKLLERVYQAISDALNELPQSMCSNVGDSAFDAWIQRQARRSLTAGKDTKDTEDFTFLTFSEMPPFTSKHRSLMAKTMSLDIWNKYCALKTSRGFSLSNLIQCGVLRPSLGLGFVLGDEECPDTFKDLVNPIVKTWHKFDPHTQSHKSDLSPSKLKIAEAFCF